MLIEVFSAEKPAPSQDLVSVFSENQKNGKQSVGQFDWSQLILYGLQREKSNGRGGGGLPL